MIVRISSPIVSSVQVLNISLFLIPFTTVSINRMLPKTQVIVHEIPLKAPPKTVAIINRV